MANRVRKAKDWILKTGYPLELEVIDMLKAQDWEVMPSANYYDEDEEKWRELDIKAYKGLDYGEAHYTPAWPYRLTLTLIIQCKKSEKYAWVFFPVATTNDARTLRLEHIDFLKVTRVQSLASRDALAVRRHRMLGIGRDVLIEPPLLNPAVARKIKWLTEIVPFGAADFQSFMGKTVSSIGTVAPLSGKEKGRDEVFEEAATVSKASVYELELTSDVIHEVMSLLLQGYVPHPAELKPYLNINVLVPIIVFDGILCLWRGKDSDLEEIDHLVYLFDYRSPRYFGRRPITIITKGSFELLLKGLETDLTNLARKFREKKPELDRQMTLIVKSKSQFGAGGI